LDDSIVVGKGKTKTEETSLQKKVKNENLMPTIARFGHFRKMTVPKFSQISPRYGFF
jgi:hypothetical protein